MPISARAIGLSLAISMPAASQAQQAAEAPARVTVAGQRTAGADATVITAAKSKILSRSMASGCNYMSAYSAADDDAMLAYMSAFNLDNSNSNESERFRESSPNGDVSSMPLSNFSDTGALPSPAAAAGGCTNADRNFAAARNRIARKDKSLAEAFVAFDTRDYAKARELATLAYNKIGYDEAALMLAQIELNGLGTARNTPAAIVWLKKITDARFDPMRDKIEFDPKQPELITARIEATLLLAKIATLGIGTARDPAEALRWYAEAARIGFVPANNTLGMASLSGFGGPADAAKALAYFKLGAEAGYAPAQYHLAKMYYTGEQGVPQDLALAGAWFAAAAKMGHAGALYAAGRIYDLGKGVPVDQSKAIVYYKEAALKGDPEAQAALASYFYSGEIVEKNLATAKKLFTAAANRGQAGAMFNLGVMAANGEGGAKDMATAYVWFTLAKQLGHEAAGAALKAISGKLTDAEMAKAASVLNPKPPA